MQAILDSPDDDDLRQVYADWCEENGLGQRAARIRRGLAGEEVSEEYLHLTLVFRRGFADEVVTKCAPFLSPGVLEHFAWQPIRRVTLTDREPYAGAGHLPPVGADPGAPLAEAMNSLVPMPGWMCERHDPMSRPFHVPLVLGERLQPTHPRQAELDARIGSYRYRLHIWCYETLEQAAADLARAALEHGQEHGLRLREEWRREAAW